MYSYYGNFQPQFQQFQPYMQQQQVVQVNGKASIDAMKMAPNSSMLVMDTSAPLVWLCVSDGVGSITATPYDIAVHKTDEKKEAQEMEKRLAKLEVTIEELEAKVNGKSNAITAGNSASKANDQYDEKREQSSGYIGKYSYDKPKYEERDGFREY